MPVYVVVYLGHKIEAAFASLDVAKKYVKKKEEKEHQWYSIRTVPFWGEKKEEADTP